MGRRGQTDSKSYARGQRDSFASRKIRTEIARSAEILAANQGDARAGVLFHPRQILITLSLYPDSEGAASIGPRVHQSFTALGSRPAARLRRRRFAPNTNRRAARCTQHRCPLGRRRVREQAAERSQVAAAVHEPIVGVPRAPGVALHARVPGQHGERAAEEGFDRRRVCPTL